MLLDLMCPGSTQGFPGVTCRNVMAHGRACTAASAHGCGQIYETVFHALIRQDLMDETAVMLDSTTVKVHQHGGGKKGVIMRKPDVAGED